MVVYANAYKSTRERISAPMGDDVIKSKVYYNKECILWAWLRTDNITEVLWIGCMDTEKRDTDLRKKKTYFTHGENY